MAKITFQNAVVTDNGYGVEVNGKSLESIISVMLGTKAGDKAVGYGKGDGFLNPFHCNSCNVTVIIEPNPTTCVIEKVNGVEYSSVEELEREVTEAYGKYQEENGESES